MSEIFLNLRIKEMLEGKMKRYLIFGIVEVFLVVTGILIALSINNWDIKKSQRSDELNIYKNIQSRISEDREDLEGNIKYNDLYTEQFQFASSLIETNDRASLDTLVSIATNLSRYSDFHRSSNVYQNLVNSGDLKLLRNTEVITMLQDLEETYIYLNRMENIHQTMVTEMLVPELMNNIHFSSSEVERPGELYSFKYNNFFIVSLNVMEEKGEIYRRALREIAVISQLLDEEFDTH